MSVGVAGRQGTVDTSLSKPFHGKAGAATMLTPEQSAEHLLRVISHVGADDTGRVFAWDGSRVPA